MGIQWTLMRPKLLFSKTVNPSGIKWLPENVDKMAFKSIFQIAYFSLSPYFEERKKNQKEMLIVDHFKPDSSQNRLNLFELQLNTLQYIAIYIKR